MPLGIREELVSLVAGPPRVPRIGSALVSDDDIMIQGQQVDELPLPRPPTAIR